MYDSFNRLVEAVHGACALMTFLHLAPADSTYELPYPDSPIASRLLARAALPYEWLAPWHAGEYQITLHDQGFHPLLHLD